MGVGYKQSHHACAILAAEATTTTSITPTPTSGGDDLAGDSG